MITFAKNIKVKEVLSVNILSTRATARALFDKAIDTEKSKIKLNFKDIEFTSRSFMDELNYLIKNQSDVVFLLKNMNSQVSKMHRLVNKPKSTSSSKREVTSNLVTI